MEYKSAYFDTDMGDFAEQLHRFLVEFDHRNQSFRQVQENMMAMDACGPWEYTIDQTVSKPAPKVSQCCKAPVFSEEGRWICEACRLGTRPVSETQATR